MNCVAEIGDAQVGAPAARSHFSCASHGEIKVHRNLVRQRDRQVRQHRCFAGRQNDCDSFIGKFLLR